MTTTTKSPRWYTSSYSNNGGACVEVAANLAASHGVVPVRDSKNTDGPALFVPSAQWAAFIATVKDGRPGI